MGEKRETIRLTVNADEVVYLRLLLSGIQEGDYQMVDDVEYLQLARDNINLKDIIVNMKIAELRRELSN